MSTFRLCFSGVLGYLMLAMVGELGFDGAKVYWLLLLMVLCLPLTIWLFLVLTDLGVSVWSLPPVFVGFYRYSGRPVALIIADLLGGLQIVGSSKGNAF